MDARLTQTEFVRTYGHLRAMSFTPTEHGARINSALTTSGMYVWFNWTTDSYVSERA